jgi:hypothetical protein
MGWKIETICLANRIILVTDLQSTQFKGISYHSELRLLNQQEGVGGEETWDSGNGVRTGFFLIVNQQSG